MPFLDSLDLANRACQHLGNPQILSIDEDSRVNFELAFAYDKVRRAELRRNTWRFATRSVVLRPVQESTYLFKPNVWSATTLYLPGAIVSDTNGNYWHSTMPENMNNIPGQSKAWDQYFGPMTVDQWTSATSYYSGDLVYVLGANSSYVVYRSLRNGNSVEPGGADAWDSAVTYSLNQVVSYSGAQWRSLLTFNTNNLPTTQPAAWDTLAVYGADYVVTADDGYVYISKLENNVGHYPPQDDGTYWMKTGAINAWSKLPTIYPSDTNWLPLYASVQPMYIVSPMGYSADLASATRATYRLPSNYLRECPIDPKAGSVSVLGAPSGLPYNDWIFEGDFLLTRDTGPLMFRFVADITVVAAMDDMFCEGLSCRMALAAAEPITASSKKKSDIEREYSHWISEARLVNGIEVGAEEPPEDDWISCRI